MSAQVVKMYVPEVAGVKEYQMLRDTLVWQDGRGGSPTLVAFVMSAATDVLYGNGPAGGITSAAAHMSLSGGGAGWVMRSWTAVLPAVGAVVLNFQTTMKYFVPAVRLRFVMTACSASLLHESSS